MASRLDVTRVRRAGENSGASDKRERRTKKEEQERKNSEKNGGRGNTLGVRMPV